MTTAPTITHSVFRAEGFTCPSCVTKIEKQVKKLPGVKDASVRFASSRVEVDHDAAVTSIDEIVRTIANAGYQVAPTAF